MATPARSRYRYSTLISDGTEVYLGAPAPFALFPQPDDRFYTVLGTEDLPQISTAVFGDPRYWWVVAEYNGLLDPFAALPAGTELRVPSLRRLQMEVLR